MEREKRNKILKILGYVLFGLAVAVIITLSILSAVYKDKTNELDEKNKQIENLQAANLEHSEEFFDNFIPVSMIEE